MIGVTYQGRRRRVQMKVSGLMDTQMEDLNMRGAVVINYLVVFNEYCVFLDIRCD